MNDIVRVSYLPSEEARQPTSVVLHDPEVYGLLGASTIKGHEYNTRVGARTGRQHIICTSLITGIDTLVQDRKYASWHQGRTVRVHKATIPISLNVVWLTEFNHAKTDHGLPKKPVLQVEDSSDAIDAAIDWLVDGGMDYEIAQIAVQKSLNIP